MQIGEFAKICNTKITVLRHYDKEGLLEPDYVDSFTGYRYYSKEQIPIFFRITALKKAGFSLSEIKQILFSCRNNEEILSLFEKKQDSLYEMIKDLDDARKIIVGQPLKFDVNFSENNGVIRAESTSFNANYEKEAYERTESAISAKHYQRISPYRLQSIPNSGYAYLICDVIKLKMNAVNIHDDLALPFVNDEEVVGKWEIVGEYAEKSDFFAGKPKNFSSVADAVRNIYFLPQGKRYWCYSWTKGYLLCKSDADSTVNPYTTEYYENDCYMFVKMKSYEYRYGGNETLLVLRRLDRVAYREEDIRKQDRCDFSFVRDDQILGGWKVFDCCRTKERFDPNRPTKAALAVSCLRFEENGKAILSYCSLDKTTGKQQFCRWTNGVLIRENLACAYELRIIDGREYLFLEWKNGDYVYANRDPWYYVFVRELSQ